MSLFIVIIIEEEASTHDLLYMRYLLYYVRGIKLLHATYLYIHVHNKVCI